MLTCKEFLYNLSDDFVVCWSFSYCFWYSLYFCITISYITLLPIDTPHAVAVDIVIAINPIPVRDKLMELDVVAIRINVSIDFNIVVNNLYFF